MTPDPTLTDYHEDHRAWEERVTNPFHTDVEPDVLTMCREECEECRGPASCPALGLMCEMQRTRPGVPPRRVE